ncbi:non-ltr retroelement reverse transcriptase, partial [Striga asiatica]
AMRFSDARPYKLFEAHPVLINLKPIQKRSEAKTENPQEFSPAASPPPVRQMTASSSSNFLFEASVAKESVEGKLLPINVAHDTQRNTSSSKTPPEKEKKKEFLSFFLKLSEIEYLEVLIKSNFYVFSIVFVMYCFCYMLGYAILFSKILLNFGGVKGSSLHWKKWEDLSLPQKMGGLGFHDRTNLEKALKDCY